MGEVTDFRHPENIRGPSAVEAERGLIGAILYENSVYDLVSDLVGFEAFSESWNGRIFQTCGILISNGKRADPVTVQHELKTENPQAMDYLLDLLEISTTSTGVVEYAKIIQERWRQRELIRLADRIGAEARGGAPSAGLIESSERDLMALQMASKGLALVGADEAIDRVTFQLDNPSASFGVKTGLSPIDDVTGGFMPGELWLIAGRPGAGKSAIASSAALNVARLGRGPDGEPLGVIEICSEMTVEQMMRRHISDLCYELFGPEAPSYSTIRKRAMSRDQRAMFDTAARELRTLGTLKSIYRTGLNIAGIRSLVRRQKTAWHRQGIKLGLVVIDHVGLVKAANQGRGRTQEQGEVAREMKELPGELEAAVVALVQLNRKVEERDDKRPLLSDLRDSGEWEENADGVIGVYREAYYAQREIEPKRHDLKMLWEERRTSVMVDAILMKIREGQMQTVRLWTDMARNAIRGHAPDSYYAHRPAPLIDLLDPDTALPQTAYDPSEFA